jgi:hypothetical protein
LKSSTSSCAIVGIDEPLAHYAGDLAAEYDLRGDDAIHLACALHVQGDDILLATWASALNAAARATGRLIANDRSSALLRSPQCVELRSVALSLQLEIAPRGNGTDHGSRRETVATRSMLWSNETISVASFCSHPGCRDQNCSAT